MGGKSSGSGASVAKHCQTRDLGGSRFNDQSVAFFRMMASSPRNSNSHGGSRLPDATILKTLTLTFWTHNQPP